MKPSNLKYEIINGRYIIGYFDDTGWHFYKEVASEEEAKRECEQSKTKRKRRRKK